METPYIDELEATILIQEQLLSLLKEKKSIIQNELQQAQDMPGAYLSDLSIVNLKIDLIDTNARLETQEKVIAQKTEYFEKYAKNFEIEYKDMLLNYEKVLERAEKIKFKIPSIDSLLNAVNKETLEKNKEAKLFFYKKIKGLLP